MALDRDTPFEELSESEKRQRLRWLHEAERRGELRRTTLERIEERDFWDEIEVKEKQRDRELQQSKLRRELKDKEPNAWAMVCLGTWFISGILGVLTAFLAPRLGISVDGDGVIWLWAIATVVCSFVVARSSARKVREEYEARISEQNDVGDYREYLRSAHWKVTREAALQRAGHRCQLCGSHSGTLEVHHNTYENIGNERPEDLIVLCRDCHGRFHAGGRMPQR